MKRKIKATIFYKMDEGHRDKDCVVGGWEKGKEFSFSDTYIITEGSFYSEDDMYEYIKHDLALVAGGGYTTDHIYDTRYEFA